MRVTAATLPNETLWNIISLFVLKCIDCTVVRCNDQTHYHHHNFVEDLSNLCLTSRTTRHMVHVVLSKALGPPPERPHVGINIMYTTRLLRGLYFVASRNPQFDIRKERPEYTNAFAQLYLQVARAESQLIESLDLDQKNESNTIRYVCSSLTTTLTGLQDAWLARSATYNIGIYVNSRVQSTLDLILFVAEMSVFAKSMALIEKRRETTDTVSDITLRILPVINRLVASKPPRPRMRIEFRRVYTLMLYLGRKPAGQVLAMRDAPVELGPDLVEGRKQAYDAFVGFASSIPQMFLYWKHPGGPSHVWQVDGPDKTGINEV